MNCRLIIFILLSFCIKNTLEGQSVRKSNPYVAFEARVKEKTLRAGGSGSLLFTLKPQHGIHINFSPAVTVTLDSSKRISSSGRLQISKRDTLVDVSKPIVQPIAIAHAAPPGPTMLRGTLTYYYCSDTEGWCSRFLQPFAVTIPVVK